MATTEASVNTDHPDGFGSLRKSAELVEAHRKCEEAQSQLEALKSIARRALGEFDELRKKCDENYEQCVKERKSHDESREELKQVRDELLKLKSTTQRAYEEYGEFQDKLDLEKDLREKAEEYAQEVVRENQALRGIVKESGASLPKAVEGEVKEDEDEPSKNELKTGVVILHDQWSAAEQRLAKANSDIETAQAELQRVKAEAEQAQQNLEKEKGELEHMKDLSRVAVEEFEQLKSRFEKETEGRLAAERFAAQQHAEANMVKRQSALVIGQATEDERIREAFKHLDELNKEISETKSQHKEKVAALEEEIEQMRKEHNRQSIEENILLTDQRCEVLEQNVRSAEERANNAEHKVAVLEHELGVLKAAGGSAQTSSSPAPPPPPPPGPPPPPPPPPTLRPLTELVKNISKGKKRTKELPKEDPRQDAMSEMMDRIKSGKVALRHAGSKPAAKPAPVKANAMDEIASLIRKGTTMRSVPKPDLNKKPKPETAVSSELQSLLNRQQRKIAKDSPDGPKPGDKTGHEITGEHFSSSPVPSVTVTDGPSEEATDKEKKPSTSDEETAQTTAKGDSESSAKDSEV